jgi:hypothetical protein
MSSVNKIATLLLSSLGALTSTSPVQFATAFSSHPVATATPSVQRLQRSRIYNSIASEGEHMKILGVCGGIGSGKSTACKVMVDTLGCVGRIGELSVQFVITCSIIVLTLIYAHKMPIY